MTPMIELISFLRPTQFVDYLTGEFLEEQYKGQRELAGKIATLGKMVANQGAELADFLFDKQML